VRDMARVAAILHRAADLNHIPVIKHYSKWNFLC
jgi:hypothetical protein